MYIIFNQVHVNLYTHSWKIYSSIYLTTYTCRFKMQNKWAASWQNNQNDCAPREDSDQPGHPPSLIRVFAVRMKEAWVLSHPLSAQRRLWSDWADAKGWSESLLGTHVILLVLSWQKPSFKMFLPHNDMKIAKKSVPLLSNILLYFESPHDSWRFQYGHW